MSSFERIFRNEFDIPDEVHLSDALLMADLGFDSLELFRLAVVLEAIAPGFEFPAQMEYVDVRFADVEHYLGTYMNSSR